MRLLLLAPLLLTGCFAHFSGNVQTGKYSGTFIGADAQGFAQTSSGVTAEKIDTSTGFRELNKTARFGLGASAAKAIAGDLAGAWKSTTNAKTAAGVSNAAAKEVTNQAAIGADVDKARIAAETIAAP